MPEIVLPEGQSPPDIINELAVSIAAASAAVVVSMHATAPRRHTCMVTDMYYSMHTRQCLLVAHIRLKGCFVRECVPAFPTYLPTYLPSDVLTLYPSLFDLSTCRVYLCTARHDRWMICGCWTSMLSFVSPRWFSCCQSARPTFLCLRL